MFKNKKERDYNTNISQGKMLYFTQINVFLISTFIETKNIFNHHI